MDNWNRNDENEYTGMTAQRRNRRRSETNEEQIAMRLDPVDPVKEEPAAFEAAEEPVITEAPAEPAEPEQEIKPEAPEETVKAEAPEKAEKPENEI